MEWGLSRVGPLPCKDGLWLRDWETQAQSCACDSQLEVRWGGAACSAPSLARSWMAWQGKCQPQPSPGELSFLWKKAKYGFVPAVSRTAQYSYVFLLTMLGVGGRSVVNMWPGGEERCSIRETWKQKSLESKSSGPTCPRVTGKQRKAFPLLSHSTSIFCTTGIQLVSPFSFIFNISHACSIDAVC